MSCVLENYQGRSATDAYGIAEPSNIATAPAIANAVYNAIGVRLRALADDAGGGPRRARQNALRGVEDMKRFAWMSARIDFGGMRRRLRRTVADAMTASARHRTVGETSIVKAGGIDLLDLLKENLLAPTKVVSLKEIPGLPSLWKSRRRPAHRAMVTLANLADALRCAAALSGARRCAHRFGEPANPQCRDFGRQSAAAAALLVFPGGGISLR